MEVAALTISLGIALQPKEDKAKEQSSLLYVEVIPSPNTSEEELENASLKVVTHTQAQQKAHVHAGNATTSSKNTKRMGDTSSSKKRHRTRQTKKGKATESSKEFPKSPMRRGRLKTTKL